MATGPKASPSSLSSEADSGAFERVRVLFADQLNLARGKYLPASFAAKGAARLCGETDQGVRREWERDVTPELEPDRADP